MKIETLVVTMNQVDLSKFIKMNINTDAIFANQCDTNFYEETEIKGRRVRMVSTNTIGVGLNRNIALNLAEGEICLLADDDIVYNDNYKKIIEDAFYQTKDADIIIFNIGTKGTDLGRRNNSKVTKVKFYNYLNYGAVRIAFKRKAVLRKNIWFSHLFGGGADYSSGEDTLFLSEALKKGLKIYTYPQSIGYVNQSTSTWFSGYNKKFFYDKGALVYNLFPFMFFILDVIYFPLKFQKKTNLSHSKIARLMLRGGRGFKKGTTYSKDME